MDSHTAERLNAINRAFYRATAADFDRTRGAAWPGWTRLLPHLPRLMYPQPRPLPCHFSVLDVGCGNGRLGVFLAGQAAADVTLHYHGLDADETLLARAEAALSPLPGVITHLTQQDILTTPIAAGAYDLVALFGVIHHVPGAAARRDLLRALARRVAADGLLAFAAWRFWEYPRFRERAQPWPEDLVDVVEAGDYLLDWRGGTHARRYCHHVDDAEHADLIAAAVSAAPDLRVVDAFRADGRDGRMNRYSVLRRRE